MVNVSNWLGQAAHRDLEQRGQGVILEKLRFGLQQRPHALDLYKPLRNALLSDEKEIAGFRP